MALGLNKILIAGSNTNTPGAYWQLTTVSATTAGTVVPAGTYIAFATANVIIQAVSAYNTTTSTATWSNVGAINVGGVVISDGVNVRLLATTNATVTLATVNGGLEAAGTYND